MSETVEAEDVASDAIDDTAVNDGSVSASLLQSILSNREPLSLRRQTDLPAEKPSETDDEPAPPSGSSTLYVELYTGDTIKQFEITQIEHGGKTKHWFVVLGCGDKQIVCDLRAENLACLETEQMIRLKAAMTLWANRDERPAQAASNSAAVTAIITGPGVEPFTIFGEI